jgi:hypothetical protein
VTFTGRRSSRLAQRESLATLQAALQAEAMTVPHPLDNPVLASLTGPHARFAERRGNVLRYPVDVAPFLALPDEPDEADWADAADLVGPGGLLPLAGIRGPAPAGERLHPEGWTEISAVCTDGLAGPGTRHPADPGGRRGDPGTR